MRITLGGGAAWGASGRNVTSTGEMVELGAIIGIDLHAEPDLYAEQATPHWW